MLLMKMLFNFFIQNKTRAGIIAVLWTAAIFIACLIPGRDVPSVSFPLMDKWVHFIIFGGFSFLWLAVFQTTNVGKRMLLFLLAVLVGYLVELLQGSGITSGRSYDMWDVLADGVGGALGVILFYLMERKYKHGS
jgi:VanZ family protein